MKIQDLNMPFIYCASLALAEISDGGGSRTSVGTESFEVS